MKVCKTHQELQAVLEPLHSQGASLGFVPTMGALHRGHLSLVDSSMAQNDHTVLSIFVNPTQFDRAEDLEKYPRTLETDLSMLQEHAPEVIVFYPESKALYKGNIQAREYDMEGLDQQMEGAHRKGHFAGVATVIYLFLDLIKPDRAYFGEKDYQQLLVVRKLVEIEDLPVEIVGCPIVREPNGLAMSSRNKRLNAAQIEKAALINRTLLEVREKFGSTPIPELKEMVARAFGDEPELELEYFVIADAETMKEVTFAEKGNHYRGFIAVFAGTVRLIDNMALN